MAPPQLCPEVFTWEINPECLFKLALPGLLAYRIYVLGNAYHGITRECKNPREKYGMKLLWADFVSCNSD